MWLGTLAGCEKPPAPEVTPQAGEPAAVPFDGKIENSIRDSKPAFRLDPKAAEGAPNVVVILADDLGFADIAPFGSEIRTPNLDRLAANGLRYNNFTVTAMCSPTRAALLTGLNHHAAGVGWIAEWDFGYPGYRGEMTDQAITLPEVLRQNGYQTLAIGKWHLANGEHRSRIGPFDAWPTHKGFDRYWGFLEGQSDQFLPQYLVSGTEIIDTPTDPNFYLPDALTAHAIEMVKDLRAVDQKKPFFLYYATGAVHAPHHTLAADRERYRGKYDQGWDAIRAQRLARQKQLGIVPANTDLTPRNPNVEAWDALSDDQRKMYARFQENYAGFVDNTDQQIGKLLDYLESIGELDNTIVIFLSDNGASPEGDVEGQSNELAFFHYHKTTTAENLKYYDVIGSAETYPHYPWGWAQASNTPFQQYKRYVHGGGLRAPLIISWLNGIKAHGQIRSQYHHVDDLMPTLLELLHIPAPSGDQGRTVKPMEGISLAYTLDQPNVPSQKTEQYYELEGNRGYYQDGWKLVSKREPNQPFEEAPWELYNLNEDFSEAHDLAAAQPEKVKELEAKWWEAAKRYQVLPIIDVGLLERSAYAKFILLPGPSHVELRPGGGTVPHNRAPLLAGKSYTITASVERTGEDQQGVLVAQGDHYAGYTFFVKDNYLYYERNTGADVIRIKSSEALPVGPLQLQFRFDKVSTGLAVAKGLMREGVGFNRLSVLEGTGSLWVNGKKVGEAVIKMPFLVAWEGLDVGEDRQSPVSPLYAGQSPFAFDGHLSKVVYEIED